MRPAKALGSSPRPANATSILAPACAVNSLGHAHPHLVSTLLAAAGRPWHVSNLYQIPQAERLARRLVDATFADLVFFCNSGAEAVECAIKTARKFHAAKGEPHRYRLVTFEGAFHGRTLATLAACGNPKYIEGFGPKVEGFDPAPFGDLSAVEALIGPETAGVLIEAVQGEGGVRAFPRDFLKALRGLCDRHGLLLVVDEAQTGVGTHGQLSRHRAGGRRARHRGPRQRAWRRFPDWRLPCDERSGAGHDARRPWLDFRRHPLAASVANAVLDVVLAPGFFERVARLGSKFRQGSPSSRIVIRA